MSMEISSGSPEPQRQGALPEPARTLVRRAEEVQERADASYAEVLEQTRFMGTAMPPDYVRVEREFQNVDQTVIRVTEDRAELILEKALKQSRARLAWTAPASVLLAITLALQAAAFHDWLSISAATWEAFFMLANVFALAVTVFYVARAIQAPNQKRLLAETIKQLEGRADPR